MFTHLFSRKTYIFASFSGKLDKVKITQSCPTLCNPMDYTALFFSQNTGVGSFSLPQGIFPTQGSNPGLLSCRWILYQLSHKGSLVGASTGETKRLTLPGRAKREMNEKKWVRREEGLGDRARVRISERDMLGRTIYVFSEGEMRVWFL